MATRSLYGFAHDHSVTFIYRHHDGYPSVAGQEFLAWIAALYSRFESEGPLESMASNEASIKYIEEHVNTSVYAPEYAEHLAAIVKPSLSREETDHVRERVMRAMKERLKQVIKLDMCLGDGLSFEKELIEAAKDHEYYTRGEPSNLYSALMRQQIDPLAFWQDGVAMAFEYTSKLWDHDLGHFLSPMDWGDRDYAYVWDMDKHMWYCFSQQYGFRASQKLIAVNLETGVSTRRQGSVLKSPLSETWQDTFNNALR